MADRPASFHLIVHGDMHLTINHVEARRATAGEAVGAARPKGASRRARRRTFVEIGSRWLLQVVAAVTSSAAAAGLLSVLPFD